LCSPHRIETAQLDPFINPLIHKQINGNDIVPLNITKLWGNRGKGLYIKVQYITPVFATGIEIGNEGAMYPESI
jgi:hypothetical protein